MKRIYRKLHLSLMIEENGQIEEIDVQKGPSTAPPFSPQRQNSTSFAFPPRATSPDSGVGQTLSSPRHRNSTGSNSSQASSGFESMKIFQGNSGASSNPYVNVQVATLRGESPPSRNSYHSSGSSSLGSLERLDESGFYSHVNVPEMILNGVQDSEIIAVWLQSLHYDEYVSLFLNAGYDLPTIARMTPEDLIAIGITKPGHRKKITTEIHKLNIPCNLPNYKPATLYEWLSVLNMSEYVPVFDSQGYGTLDDIVKLTWEDMEDIGVKKLGHLKKLTLAIKRLRDLRHQRRESSSGTGIMTGASSGGEVLVINGGPGHMHGFAGGGGSHLGVHSSKLSAEIRPFSHLNGTGTKDSVSGYGTTGASGSNGYHLPPSSASTGGGQSNCYSSTGNVQSTADCSYQSPPTPKTMRTFSNPTGKPPLAGGGGLHNQHPGGSGISPHRVLHRPGSRDRLNELQVSVAYDSNGTQQYSPLGYQSPDRRGNQFYCNQNRQQMPSSSAGSFTIHPPPQNVASHHSSTLGSPRHGGPIFPKYPSNGAAYSSDCALSSGGGHPLTAHSRQPGDQTGILSASSNAAVCSNGFDTFPPRASIPSPLLPVHSEESNCNSRHTEHRSQINGYPNQHLSSTLATPEKHSTKASAVVKPRPVAKVIAKSKRNSGDLNSGIADSIYSFNKRELANGANSDPYRYDSPGSVQDGHQHVDEITMIKHYNKVNSAFLNTGAVATSNSGGVQSEMGGEHPGLRTEQYVASTYQRQEDTFLTDNHGECVQFSDVSSTTSDGISTDRGQLQNHYAPSRTGSLKKNNTSPSYLAPPTPPKRGGPLSFSVSQGNRSAREDNRDSQARLHLSMPADSSNNAPSRPTLLSANNKPMPTPTPPLLTSAITGKNGMGLFHLSSTTSLNDSVDSDSGSMTGEEFPPPPSPLTCEESLNALKNIRSNPQMRVHMRSSSIKAAPPTGNEDHSDRSTNYANRRPAPNNVPAMPTGGAGSSSTNRLPSATHVDVPGRQQHDSLDQSWSSKGSAESPVQMRRNVDSVGSMDSVSSTETLPFAQENMGTIKSKGQRGSTLGTEDAGELEGSIGGSNDNEDQMHCGSVGMVKKRSPVMDVFKNGNLPRQPLTNDNGDVLDGVYDMLQGLTDELNAMLVSDPHAAGTAHK